MDILHRVEQRRLLRYGDYWKDFLRYLFVREEYLGKYPANQAETELIFSSYVALMQAIHPRDLSSSNRV